MKRTRRGAVETDAARTRLERLLEELDASAATFDHGNGTDTGDVSHLDQHAAEAASELTGHERDEALRLVVADQRVQVRAALDRLADGTYGRCVDCGQDLPDERLDARPEAARCVDCQHSMELAR
jgi:RNA polymerase-binding transcription factor DksA